MARSIHYSGRIRFYNQIEQLVNEVRGMAVALRWQYICFPVSMEDPLKGIMIAPPGGDPLFFSFLPNGVLCSPVNILYRRFFGEKGIDQDCFYTTNIRTQEMGISVHWLLIHLLRYLQRKYFAEFHLYETDNENNGKVGVLISPAAVHMFGGTIWKGPGIWRQYKDHQHGSVISLPFGGMF